MEITLAVTGASGTLCARALLRALAAHPDVHRVNAIVSSAAVMVAREELGPSDASLAAVREILSAPAGGPSTGGPAAGPPTESAPPGGAPTIRWFDENNVGAPIASGSHLSAGMAIVPCSTGTLGAIASGSSRNLIHRAAEVTLKERRRLVLGVREAPLSLIHLENMAAVTKAGAIVLPITPAFYHQPRTIDDVVAQYVGRVLDLLGLPHGGARWRS